MPGRKGAVSEVFDSAFMAKLERLSFRAKRAFRSLSYGASPTTRQGASVEFSNLRRYSTGDDFRYVDWNAFARLNELFLKLFHEEGDISLYLLIDASSSMAFGSPSKLMYAKRLAAALAYVALSNLDLASVVMVRESECEGLPLLKGKKQIFRIFDFLEGQQGRGRTSLRDALRVFSAETRHAGQAILISDLMDETAVTEGLRYLKHLGFGVQVVHLQSPEEIEPPFESGASLADSETGEEIRAGDIEAYTREREVFSASFQRNCAKSSVPYLSVSTATPFEDLILRGDIFHF